MKSKLKFSVISPWGKKTTSLKIRKDALWERRFNIKIQGLLLSKLSTYFFFKCINSSHQLGLIQILNFKL